ncbi:MAG: OmpW family outer membrane protein [Amaricoccus sp.]
MYRGKILAAAAVAAVGLGAGAASAQGLGGGGFYLKGFGGWTLPQNENFDLTDKATGLGAPSGFDYDSGYILGLAGGYTLSPNVALELEYAYRNANADLKNFDSRGDVTSNAFMANAIYTFQGMGPNGAFKPYLGAGLGAADVNAAESNASKLSGAYNFAYQVITGVSYDLNPNVSLNGEVRYFGIADQNLENSDLKAKTPYNTFDALVGVTYHF